MSDARPTPADAAITPKAAGKKKTVIMVAALLAVEAVVIVGALKFLGGGPKPVSAVQVAHGEADDESSRLVETPVLEARLPNNKSGVAYIYPTEIYVQVRQRHADQVKSEIEQFQNEIKAEISAIWRSAEPQYFQEPKLENLTRKIQALLNDRFGMDKEHGEPVIHKVVLVMSTGFRIDS